MIEPLALVIEDDELIGEIYTTAVREAGYRVIVINNGNEALEMLKGCTPALIVLDLHLPQVPGVTILQAILSDQRLKKTRVIIVSGDSTLTEYVRDRADLVLVKPVGFNQLIQLALRLRPDNATGVKRQL